MDEVFPKPWSDEAIAETATAEPSPNLKMEQTATDQVNKVYEGPSAAAVT
jgi:hypothetical protein